MHSTPAFTMKVRHIKAYTDVDEAIAALKAIYDKNRQELREAVQKFIGGDQTVTHPLTATYPFLGCQLTDTQFAEFDNRQAFGLVDQDGLYEMTVTYLNLFESYLREQMTLLQKAYKMPFYVGESDALIPVSFVLDGGHLSLSEEMEKRLKTKFKYPDLERIDDRIVNHTYQPSLTQSTFPMSLFTAERVDFSLHRLRHYTGTQPKSFQNFILLTNYQRYVREFISYGLERVAHNPDETFSVPGGGSYNATNLKEIGEVRIDSTTLFQMPAYHLERPDGNGVTLINIGVGPTNAKTITDHLAVLRPHCWIMLGHCAGLRSTQKLGDYVLAHGYVRDDRVLDQDLPMWVPIPPIAEIQLALQGAVAEVTGLEGAELKTRMRTGTVFTSDNRNWELRAHELFEKLNQSRSIAVDLESATIAANGLRFRVPYGTLLCVSDKPIHGDIKLPGMANAFYESQVAQHLRVGLMALEIIRKRGIDSLHSRKLRGFNEPPFR